MKTSIPYIATQDFKFIANQDLWNKFHRHYRYRKSLLKYKMPLINLENVIQSDFQNMTVKHYDKLISDLPNLEDKHKLDVALAGLKFKLPSKVLNKMMGRE